MIGGEFSAVNENKNRGFCISKIRFHDVKQCMFFIKYGVQSVERALDIIEAAGCRTAHRLMQRKIIAYFLG